MTNERKLISAISSDAFQKLDAEWLIQNTVLDRIIYNVIGRSGGSGPSTKSPELEKCPTEGQLLIYLVWAFVLKLPTPVLTGLVKAICKAAGVEPADVKAALGRIMKDQRIGALIQTIGQEVLANKPALNKITVKTSSPTGYCRIIAYDSSYAGGTNKTGVSRKIWLDAKNGNTYDVKIGGSELNNNN